MQKTHEIVSNIIYASVRKDLKKHENTTIASIYLANIIYAFDKKTLLKVEKQ